MLIVAGFQVPVIPLVEVAGRGGAEEFWQSGPICVNAGVIEVVITISIVVDAAHCPAAGVKLYVLVPVAEVLIVAGFQVPVIPLVEVAGRAGAEEFWHRGPIWVNAGVIEVVITISIVVEAAH